MRVISRILLITILFASIYMFSAFSPKAISIDFGMQTITLTENTLQNGWYNHEDKNNYTQNKTLPQRAISMTDQDTFEKTFPDIVYAVDKLANKFEIPADNGTVIFKPHTSNRFNVSGQKNGKAINREKLYADILSKLQSNKYGYIKAEYKIVDPLPEEKIIKSIVKRSEFSTSFKQNPPREHNIALSISKFNGLTVLPGEEVSFNKIVGARSAKNGYKEAKVILDGEYIDGLGGGVCQTSTTIFNAVAKAGLHITKSQSHSLASSYIGLGKDAMVSSASDLKFVNNTSEKIYFETKTDSSKVYVTIYGRTKGDNINYKLSTKVTKEYSPKEKIDASVPEEIIKEYKLNPDHFVKEVINPGAKGYLVKTYIETYKGNKLLSKKLLRKSGYLSQPIKYIIYYKPVTLPIHPDTEYQTPLPLYQ